jgi:hypothetical protein
MCAGSISDKVEEFDSLGLVSGHAYTIVKIILYSFKFAKFLKKWSN